MNDPTSVIPFKLVRLEEEGYHILVTGKVGRKNARLIIDTGASRTVFDESFIREYFPGKDLNPHHKASTAVGSNSIPVSTLEIPKLLLGDIVLLNYQVAVIDLSHVNGSYAEIGMKPIQGVLGGDILYRTKARIDFKTEELFLNQPEL